MNGIDAFHFSYAYFVFCLFLTFYFVLCDLKSIKFTVQCTISSSNICIYATVGILVLTHTLEIKGLAEDPILLVSLTRSPRKRTKGRIMFSNWL